MNADAREFRLRPAEAEDAPLLLRLIKELADYEKAEQEVVATVDDIRDSLFGDDSTAEALICCVNGKPVGYAVYFYNYSTWLGKKGLYLEDLYISPQFRGKGSGKAVLQYLARTALEKNCGRFEWSVLDWNTPAIKLYQSIGAKLLTEWQGCRLSGKSLVDFAASEEA